MKYISIRKEQKKNSGYYFISWYNLEWNEFLP